MKLDTMNYELDAEMMQMHYI